MPCSPRRFSPNSAIQSMASSRSKLDFSDPDLKRSFRGDESTVNSDTETLNNEEEDDIVEPTSPSKPTTSTRLKHRQGTNSKKRVVVRKKRITANISATKYDVVRRACVESGMAVTKEDDPNCFLYWSDSAVPSDKITELKSYQRINHFPGMGEICKKDSLARNIAKMQRAHPDEYSFTPQTWVIPAEYASFQCYCKELKKKKKVKTFIIKPANGAMGNGISLIRNGDRVPSHEQIVIQEYIDRPFLLDGFKFDLRVYVLITSCDPMKIFVYDDGLVRLGTEAYEAPSDDNLDELFMHLTNYSINKHNENFEKDDSNNNGSKRTIKYLKEWLQSMEYDVVSIWRSITDVIVKTLIVAQPHVLHSYRTARPGAVPGSDSVCFELLGFDIMLDRKLRPWVLEVNRSPSFGTDSKLDAEIKGGALRDMMRLLNIKASDRRRGMAAEKAESQKRLLTQPKRTEYGMSELEKKRIVLNKRRVELKHRLNRIRREAAREEYENMNMGNFKRVFPPDERSKLEKYNGLLADAYKLFLSGRASMLQREVNQPFSTLREEEILDLLEQCEADETLTQLESSTIQNGHKPYSKGPKPLSSMPSSKFQREDSTNVSSSSLVAQRQASDLSLSSSFSARSAQRIVTSLSSPPMKFNPVVDAAYLNAAVREREEELCRRTLQALEDMRIKFPGKTDEEAETILQNIQENWKFHKPRVASYWLVKLDSIKRRKVIDIVRTNTRAILQRIWRSSDVDNLRLCRIFSRVFNRLLWSHGQGLWNCFSSIGNSWETIFSKSTEVLSTTEMSSCRRIVELCRDCLLIVYQFASDAKAAGTTTKTDETTTRESVRRVPDLTSQHVLSSRMARLSKGNQVPSL